MARRWLMVALICLAALPGGADSARTDPTPTAAPSTASAPYRVILANGARIPARSKPISAFGSFRFVDEDGRTRVLRPSMVDVEATRAFNAGVDDGGRGGTLSVVGSVSGGAGSAATAGGSESTTAPSPTAELDDRRRRTSASITVYSATWCGYCTKLKSFLRSEGLPAEIIEIDRLPAAEQRRHQAEMKRHTGRVAYPTVVIDGQAIAGFNPAWIRRQVER